METVHEAAPIKHYGVIFNGLSPDEFEALSSNDPNHRSLSSDDPKGVGALTLVKTELMHGLKVQSDYFHFIRHNAALFGKSSSEIQKCGSDVKAGLVEFMCKVPTTEWRTNDVKGVKSEAEWKSMFLRLQEQMTNMRDNQALMQTRVKQQSANFAELRRQSTARVEKIKQAEFQKIQETKRKMAEFQKNLDDQEAKRRKTEAEKTAQDLEVARLREERVRIQAENRRLAEAEAERKAKARDMKYYYWRQYGNNAICLYESNKSEYDNNRGYWWTGTMSSSSDNTSYWFSGTGKYYNKTFGHPKLTYCGNTYWYGYFSTRKINANGQWSCSIRELYEPLP